MEICLNALSTKILKEIDKFFLIKNVTLRNLGDLNIVTEFYRGKCGSKIAKNYVT